MGYEFIVRRIDEIKSSQIHMATYCTVLTLHSWHVFLMYLVVQVVCCLIIYVSIFTHFLVLLWLNDWPSWSRNWLPLNKHTQKNLLVVIGESVGLCDWYSNGMYHIKLPKLSAVGLIRLAIYHLIDSS
jgi:hypothetical protein